MQDLADYEEILSTLTFPPEEAHATPEFERIDYNEKWDFRYASKDKSIADLKEYVETFNSSKRYGNVIYCKRSGRCVNDHVTEVLERYMQSRGLFYQGSFRIKGALQVYHGYKVEK
jgi:hypothetical protein